MAHPSSSGPLFELWEPEVGTYGKLPLRLKPGTKTGYQGVHKVKKKTFQARRVTSGKLRHVYTHDVDGPRYCAYILVAADAGFVDDDYLINLRKRSGTASPPPTSFLLPVDEPWSTG